MDKSSYATYDNLINISYRIVEILKENDITSYSIESGSGSYLAIQNATSYGIIYKIEKG